MFIPKCKPFLSVFPPVVVTMMICLLLAFVATSVMAFSGGQVTSKKTSVPIVIDAELDDPAWKAVRPDFEGKQDVVVDPQDWYQLPLKSGAGNTNEGGIRVSRGQIDGDDDLKVVWMTVWDDDFLYFAFEVTDDMPVVYEGDMVTRTPDMDGIWLCFDTLHDAPVIEFPEKEFSTEEVSAVSVYEADDFYLAVGPLTIRDYPATFLSAGDEHPLLNDPANGHVAGMQTSIGYNAEIRLPWSIFEPYYGGTPVPGDGMVFGFDFTFIDVDPTYAAPEGGAMAWSSDFHNDNSPGVLGELFLSTEALGTAVNSTGKLPSVWGKIKNQQLHKT